MNAGASPENLEMQAQQQRSRIHNTALELISKVDEAKEQLSEQLSVKHQLHKHFVAATLVASIAAFFSGYAAVSAFKQR